LFVSHPTGTSHYDRAGPDGRPVVVMVSGATLPLDVWGPIVAPLVEAGFQVIRYDLPGRGHTPAEGLGASFEAHLDQLHGLLDGLHVEGPVRLIGLASGALVVAAYTARHPARVSHACLVAPDGAATRFTLAERLLAAPFIGKLLFRFTARRTLLGRVPRYSPHPDIQAFVRELLVFSMRAPGFHQGVLSTVRTFPLHHGEALYLKLAESGTPTLVVWGRGDRITPSGAAVSLGAMFGADSVRVLEGVGHLPFVEDPAAVVGLLKRHFSAAPPS
jgi:pimeloyl-ACP methyl ester carboxylesterase